MTGQPGTYHTAVGLAATERQLYVLRDGGEVYTLFKRGDLQPGGDVVREPYWARVPAVPGTIAALEDQSGRG